MVAVIHHHQHLIPFVRFLFVDGKNCSKAVSKSLHDFQVKRDIVDWRCQWHRLQNVLIDLVLVNWFAECVTLSLQR